MKNRPYIICETACAHDGSISNLKVLIKKAISSGAKAIQLQIWEPENIMTKNHTDFKLLKKLEIKKRKWIEIISFIKSFKKKIDIIACIYDLEAFKFCKDNNIKHYKIHSSDLLNEKLIREISKNNFILNLSIGGSKLSEIQKSISWFKNKKNITLMYGYQLFPTPITNLNLQKLVYLKKKFKTKVGYQDHTDPNTIDAYTICATVVGLGINIIEKHINIDRSKKGTDSQAALNVDEFKNFVKTLNNCFISIGKADFKKITKDEKQYRKYAKKIIVAKKKIFKDDILNFKNICFKRSINMGIDIENVKKIINRRAVKDIDKDQALNFSFIKNA